MEKIDFDEVAARYIDELRELHDFTDEQILKLWGHTMQCKLKMSEEEAAYRRGYRQGFFSVLRMIKSSYRDVVEWDKSGHVTCPPFSLFDGEKYHGKNQGIYESN